MCFTSLLDNLIHFPCVGNACKFFVSSITFPSLRKYYHIVIISAIIISDTTALISNPYKLSNTICQTRLLWKIFYSLILRSFLLATSTNFGIFTNANWAPSLLRFSFGSEINWLQLDTVFHKSSDSLVKLTWDPVGVVFRSLHCEWRMYNILLLISK